MCLVKPCLKVFKDDFLYNSPVLLRASAYNFPVHVLDVARFLDRHSISVTGHKAQSSLKTYTGYTDSQTKQNMSNTLSNAL
jgi:hypothetical protein